MILGHVDSFQGPGVFFALSHAVQQDQVFVTLQDKQTLDFVVTRVVEYPKSVFPDQLVYHGPAGVHLNLVTCGGYFDHQTGHYTSNIVVFTTLVPQTIPLQK